MITILKCRLSRYAAAALVCLTGATAIAAAQDPIKTTPNAPFGVTQERSSSPRTASEVRYSRTELRQLTKEAHTQQQYQALASYFRDQQRQFQKQADLEKQEWDRRSLNTYGVAQKYPRPADSARNLHQYYAYEADKKEKLAARYEELAQSAQSADRHDSLHSPVKGKLPGSGSVAN